MLSIIKNRRTIRKYRKNPISEARINGIIEAGTMAPSPHNSQPWSFVIVKDERIKNKMLKVFFGLSNSLLAGVKVLYDNSIKIIENAPVIILVYNNHSFFDRIKRLGEPYGSLAELSEVQGISAAIQNMHLAASHEGLGMAWLTMPLLAQRKINALVKTKNELIAVLSLGFPDEKGRPTPRKPARETARYMHE